MKLKPDPSPLRWILLILLSLIWGSSFILIKKGLEHYGFIQAATIRLMTAGLSLLPLAFFQFKKIPGHKLKYVCLTGFFAMFLPAYLFCFAQQHIQSSVAGILNALTPTWTLLIAIFWFKNKFAFLQIIGLVLGLASSFYLSMLSSRTGWSINAYALLVVLATVCYGLNINLVKNHLSVVSPIAVSVCSVVFAGLMAMLIFFLPNINSFRIAPEHYSSLYALMLLGLIGSALAIIIHNYLISISTPLFASANTYFIPMVAIGWGVLAGEKLNFYHVIGMAGLMLSVGLIRKQKNATFKVSGE
ncbi:MAG: DMT family transporter [Saprospiraceae bacterium]